MGPVYLFWDPGRKDWNYIGEGINGGMRVLEAVGKEKDDVVFISGEVREQLQAGFRQGGYGLLIKSCLQNRGRRQDKHKEYRRVYELSHTQLCGKDIDNLFANLAIQADIQQGLKAGKESGGT